MKKTDIAMIMLVTAVGVLVGYILATNLTFLKPDEKGVEVQTMEELTSEVAPPNEKVFNNEAINPTVEVVVGRSGGAD